MTAPSANPAAAETPRSQPRSRNRHIWAISFWLVSLTLFWSPLRALVTLALHDERSSHILLVPLISACLIYLQRTRIFREPRFCPRIGAPLLLGAAILWLSMGAWSSLHTTDRLPFLTALMVLVWIGAFLLFYGPDSFRAARFPLLFLLLMVPLPVALADRAVSLLQRGSAETCAVLFQILGVPLLRHGFVFSLPGVTIEVAQQCSGIRSALSLFIAGLLAQHVFLRNVPAKACFILCIFPIAIFKNAVRIVTLSWLAVHVNPGILDSPLHHQGGLPFSLLSFALMALLLWMLRARWGRLQPAGAQIRPRQ